MEIFFWDNKVQYSAASFSPTRSCFQSNFNLPRLATLENASCPGLYCPWNASMRTSCRPAMVWKQKSRIAIQSWKIVQWKVRNICDLQYTHFVREGGVRLWCGPSFYFMTTSSLLRRLLDDCWSGSRAVTVGQLRIFAPVVEEYWSTVPVR